MPKHKCPEPEKDSSKAWLDSYADAMTLLLAFFILLFAFSLVDQKKFLEFKAGLHLAAGKAAPTLDGGSGILDLGSGVTPQVAAPPVLANQEKTDQRFDVSKIDQSRAEVLFDEVREQLERIRATPFVDVERDERGITIRMDASVAFQSGSAALVPDGANILAGLAPILDEIDNAILVEGHTDSQPTNGGGGFATNWELSAMRAVTTLRYLTEVLGLQESRLSAIGHSDTRPRASNETVEGRRENRRVEIVVLIEDDEIAIVAGTPGRHPLNMTPSPASASFIDLDIPTALEAGGVTTDQSLFTLPAIVGEIFTGDSSTQFVTDPSGQEQSDG